jgi:hypothetical protein
MTTAHRLPAGLVLASLLSTQPALAFEEDTHYWLTLKLATVCGFSLNDARLIASGNWAMDDGTTMAEVDVHNFVLDKWPNNLSADQKRALRPRVPSLDLAFQGLKAADTKPFGGGALWVQGLQSRNKRPPDPFGKHLDDAFMVNGNGLPGGNGVLVDLGLTPNQVTQLFLQSRQYLFHALPDRGVTAPTALADQQGSLVPEFANEPKRSAKLIKFGKFLHFLQDKWAHWDYVTGVGHVAQTWDGKDPDSAELASKTMLYERMARDTMMWFGELARQMGIPTQCNNKNAEPPIVGPWRPKELDDAAKNWVTKNVLDKQVVPLLQSIVKSSDEAWWYNRFGLAQVGPPVRRELPSSKRCLFDRKNPKIKSLRDQIVCNLAELIVKDLGKEKNQELKVSDLERLKSVKFDADGSLPAVVYQALPDDPDGAVAFLVLLDGAVPLLHIEGDHGLVVTPEGTQSRISGTVVFTNEGEISSSPGQARVLLFGLDDFEQLVDALTISVSTISPQASETVDYSTVVEGDLTGRVVAAYGVMDVGDVQAGNNQFVDSSMSVSVASGQIVLSPTPIVPYFSLPDAVVAPCAVDPADSTTTFRLRVPKLGGPSGSVSGSMLSIQVGTWSFHIEEDGGVLVGAGFEPIVEVPFVPTPLSSYLALTAPEDYPEVVSLGVTLKGQSGDQQNFGYINAPWFVKVSQVLTNSSIAGSLKIKSNPDAGKSKLKFKSKDPSIVLPASDQAPTVLGARLRVRDTMTGREAMFCLSQQWWRVIGNTDAPKGYKYKTHALLEEPCKKAVIRQTSGGAWSRRIVVGRTLTCRRFRDTRP